MTPYDPKVKCRKCGSYRTRAWVIWNGNTDTDDVERQCRQCLHQWTEPPLDAKAEKGGEG